MKRFFPVAVLLALSVAMILGLWACQKSARPKPQGAKPGLQAPSGLPAPAAAPTDADPAYVAPGARDALAKAIDFMRKTQLPDGGWPAMAGQDKANLPVTVVAAYGLLTAGVPGHDPAVEKAINYILGFVKPQGSVFAEGLENYTTGITLMLLKTADEKKYKDTIDKALAFLKSFQWDEGEGLNLESQDYGGAGYGKEKRPDLSNTQWFVQALRDGGLSPDDPAVKKALIFVCRTQASEEARFICLPDGGFIYSPHGAGESKAGYVPLPSGKQGLKTYGSMTYAGLLSLIYCGLNKDDKRVQAAHDWMAKHWTLEENPELGKDGYYYYFMTMGKALKAYGDPTLADDKGTVHEWRKELSAKLIELQKPDGSWINPASERWYEGNPYISTPFALIAMQACLAKLP